MSWYYMPQSQELDANGRRQWDTHIHPSDGRPSIPRSTQLEEWIVGARIFLGQLGSFARLAVLGNQGLPRDSPRWTPILVAAVFAHMRMDASFPSPGWIHLVPQTYWSRTNQQTRANDIKNRLDAAWDEWAQVCEEKEAGSEYVQISTLTSSTDLYQPTYCYYAARQKGLPYGQLGRARPLARSYKSISSSGRNRNKHFVGPWCRRRLRAARRMCERRMFVWVDGSCALVVCH